jgi:putative phosphoribosyl transferase
MTGFVDRQAAGRELATHLERYADRRDTVVLGLARGGLPVAVEVARALRLELDVFLVRKLGVPGHEELAMGAIASGGVLVVNEQVLERVAAPREEIDAVGAREQEELERRERTYRGGRAPADVAGRTAILVDDGLATGATMRAAALAVQQRNPARVVIAVPVAAAETCNEFRGDVDEVVCAITPAPFFAVGLWYEDFSQTSDEEVRKLLERAAGSDEVDA